MALGWRIPQLGTPSRGPSPFPSCASDAIAGPPHGEVEAFLAKPELPRVPRCVHCGELAVDNDFGVETARKYIYICGDITRQHPAIVERLRRHPSCSVAVHVKPHEAGGIIGIINQPCGEKWVKARQPAHKRKQTRLCFCAVPARPGRPPRGLFAGPHLQPNALRVVDRVGRQYEKYGEYPAILHIARSAFKSRVQTIAGVPR